MDDLIDLFPFLRGTVAHGVAGVDDPRVGVGDQFVERLWGFAHGDDIVGDPHVAGPIFREADFFIHPGENVVQGMVALFEGDEKGIRLLQSLQLKFNRQLRIDQGEDEVGFDKVSEDALVLRL